VLYQSSGWIGNIRFSPQGDKISFMDHPTPWDNRGSVCVVDLAGHVRTLSGEWESEQGVAWRPDGKEVWFSAAEKGHDLNMMGVTLEGKMRSLLALPMGFTVQDISADGRVLVALNSRRLAMAFSALDSKDDQELSWHDWNVAKDISRDGQSILFEDASEPAGPGYTVALRRVDGALPIRLGDGSAGGLSPDGKWAISISVGNPEQVTLLPTGAGQPLSVDVSGLEHIRNGWARFLANGHQISVNGNAKGHSTRCYLLDLSGAKPKAVTPEAVSCGASSPDNRFIVGMGPNSEAAIYPLDGGAPRRIPGLEAGFQPVQWSTDGQSLYGYRVGELPSKIYKIEIATGKQTMVHELHPGVPAGVVNVAPVLASRDGTKFAYSFNQTLSVLYVISGLK
jgi:Tol biopolymer transport system component